MRDFINIRNMRTRWETCSCSVTPTSENFNRCRSVTHRHTFFPSSSSFVLAFFYCIYSLFCWASCPLFLFVTSGSLSCCQQNEKCHLLIEHETQKLKELDEDHSQELKDWREKLRPRKKVFSTSLTLFAFSLDPVKPDHFKWIMLLFPPCQRLWVPKQAVKKISEI